MDALSVIIDEVIATGEDRNRKVQYRTNPVMWAKDFLGVQLWSKQADVAMSLVTNKNVAVKAGHEVGKSFLAGVLICWWIDTHWELEGGCFVVSTAPSFPQINAIVWREVRRFHDVAAKRNEEYMRRMREGKQLGDYQYADHRLPGYITSDAHWKLENGIELGYGRKPPEAKEDTMSGIHARYVLAVGDEAVGLSEGLIDDLGNITSNATSRRFLIMNPTNPLAYIAKFFKNKNEAWDTHTISVFDSPNFHGGEGLPIEVLETLVDESYVSNKLEEWGGAYWNDDLQRWSSKSPKFIARVLGEFAWDAGPTLISPQDIAAGIGTDIIPSSETVAVLGVDVARFGEDSSVAYSYHEGKLRLIDHWEKTSGTDTARRIHELAIDHGVDEVRIDGSGLGGPIADMVAEAAEALGNPYMVIEMIGGAPSPDKNRWKNARAFWFDDFATRLRNKEIDLSLEDEQLHEELMGIEYKFPLAGVQALMIESKDDMKRRGVKSPDYADAAIYASADISGVYGPQPGDIMGYDENADLEPFGGFYTQLSITGW